MQVVRTFFPVTRLPAVSNIRKTPSISIRPPVPFTLRFVTLPNLAISRRFTQSKSTSTMTSQSKVMEKMDYTAHTGSTTATNTLEDPHERSAEDVGPNFQEGLKEEHWWDGAVLYQILPRSFNDTNGDGIGDLKGITAKLPYLADLGVDAIWLSPIYKSPQKDFGYDISDFCQVDPLYGTNEDVDQLLKKAHSLGLKVLMDIVISHTSKRHPWFKESLQSRTNPKSDWYVWADAKYDGTEPNNWLSHFGGRAWEWDYHRQQYYLHHFLVDQPNLNLHNRDTLEATMDNCKFWLDKGVDGFRLDAVMSLASDPELRDNPGRGRQNSSTLDRITFDMQHNEVRSLGQPHTEVILGRLREVVDSYPNDRYVMGEVCGDDDIALGQRFTADGLLHSCYNFSMAKIQNPTFANLRDVIGRSIRRLHAQKVAFTVSHHDCVRVATRWGSKVAPELRDQLLLSVNALLTSLHGQACLYQGMELGLENTRVPYELMKDPVGILCYPAMKGRDGCRTPMPWDSAQPQLGFTTGQPWLPMCEDQVHRSCVDLQQKDPHSIFNGTRRWLRWRKSQPALVRGSVRLVDFPEPIIAIERIRDSQHLLCIFNVSDAERTLDLKIWEKGGFKLVQQCGEGFQLKGNQITVPPYGFGVVSGEASEE